MTPGDAVMIAQEALAPVLAQLEPLLRDLIAALEAAKRPSEAEALRRRYNIAQLRGGRFTEKL